jgi:glycosyltransferase involved in cell wall biosynthesis
MTKPARAHCEQRLVTVAIPAFNAASTIGATLDSVLSQTHRALDVIVVDDGSTDGTAQIVESFAERDNRVRLIRTRNGGVARARNVAADAALGAFIAPVDADDLWHPVKIEKQLAALDRAGPRAGFAYTFYRRIDSDDRVRHDGSPVVCEGSVFVRLIMNNFVGNGSALLIRREAYADVGGYDPRLQARGAHGCEDYLIQTMIARRWTVALVPEFLVGYRETPGAMSENWERMFRSNLEMLNIIRDEAPDAPKGALAAAEAAVLARMGFKKLRHLRLVGAGADIGCAILRAPGAALAVLRHEAWSRAGVVFRQLRRSHSARRVSGGSDGVRFLEMNPAQGVRSVRQHPLERWMDQHGNAAGSGDQHAERMDEGVDSGRAT